jgi:hypothetical protein
MDWPGAEEMAERFAKTIDPKLMEKEDEKPAIPPQVEQMLQQQAQMLEEMSKKLQQAEEVDMHKDQELQIKAYEAETDRMSALATAITPEQVQALVMQTVQNMMAQPPIHEEVPEQMEMHNQMEMQPQMQEQIPQEQMMAPEQQMPEQF